MRKEALGLVLFLWSFVCLIKIAEIWACLQTEKKQPTGRERMKSQKKISVDGCLRWQGPENLLHAKTGARISLGRRRQEREQAQAEPTLPDALLQASSMFSP